MALARTSRTISAASALPKSRFDVITCSATPPCGPRSPSASARGSVTIAKTARVTAATAPASRRRVASAAITGTTDHAATYGVKAKSCTIRPCSQPPSRSSAQTAPGSTSSQSSSGQATRRIRPRTGFVAGVAVAMVMRRRYPAGATVTERSGDTSHHRNGLKFCAAIRNQDVAPTCWRAK
nr:hypothetical protein GCM10020092_016790 [Actinoplanes digitatis]